MKRVFDNDPELIESLRRGDAQAYAHLVDTYNHRLCVYANSLLNDIPFSEDVVQNVFMKIWVRRNKLKPDLALKSYLYKSVYNGCLNHFKKNLTVTALEKKYIEGLDEIAERDDDALEKLFAQVREAIEDLPPKCREIFLMSKKEGLTHPEIAEYLNISKNTIERQITIAFTRIRERIGNRSDIILFLLFGRRNH